MNALTKYFIAAGVLLLVSSLLLLTWTYWEPSNIRKDSLLYKIRIPVEVKAFPVWGESGKSDYSVTNAEGLKPSAITLRYHSTLTPEEISTEATKMDFLCRQYPAGSTLCEKKISASQTIQLILDKVPSDNTSKIEVIFSGY